LIDWETSKRPDFYSTYHTVPETIEENEAFRESWNFNPNRTSKWSGKELVVQPGKRLESRENGAYCLFAWRGAGTVGDLDLVAGDPERDELLVCTEAADSGIVIVNDGDDPLVLYKIFGPDTNTAPCIYD
jgi:hypothetical protein